ncbi:hypothetical protein F0562_034144 [Nyssa sinensis]|uniref:Uncharacterized protein n=1 Tax=Nyssa sinensis TaxID=561372 RepID=A0A5J5AJ79_9ASTE|nr:hypothetical protein F0562_034144 [Nyssa sinensis]
MAGGVGDDWRGSVWMWVRAMMVVKGDAAVLMEDGGAAVMRDELGSGWRGGAVVRWWRERAMRSMAAAVVGVEGAAATDLMGDGMRERDEVPVVEVQLAVMEVRLGRCSGRLVVMVVAAKREEEREIE